MTYALTALNFLTLLVAAFLLERAGRRQHEEHQAHRAEVAELLQRVQAPEAAVIQHQLAAAPPPSEPVYPLSEVEAAQAEWQQVVQRIEDAEKAAMR